MNFKSGIAIFIAALLFVSTTTTSGIAGEKKDSESGKGVQTEQGTGHGSHHQNIESGRDFGRHVKEHNDMFSGDHNPGVHHKGYSGIKSDSSLNP